MLHLGADDLAARLPRLALVDALDQAFRVGVEAPLRQHFPLHGAAHDGSLLIMPAWNGRVIGVKLVSVFPDNATRGLAAVHATYTLLDAATGVPLATMDGSELTHRRTGAASALAARYLARGDASRLLMVGAGQLAPHLIESHAAVRPVREVRVWGRDPGRTAQRVDRLRQSGLAWAVEACGDLEASVRWADIICCATLAAQPLIRGAWLRPGQHLDLVGSFRPDMREADDDAVRIADVYVDTREGALAESGELVQAIARGVVTPAHVRADLAELAAGSAVVRQDPDRITLFKSVGTALEDLAAAQLALSGGDESLGR